ncbi:transketolase [Peptoniphilus raoultii]|uniref:transketolase n=1 Tax=Peptoniphilus raoultii TaxID=1776387 RepID=UPI0008DA1803|nr:transketolase [Peptoniphilus raoultii]
MKDINNVNTIRMLSIDQVQRANSGHPGLPLGAAPMTYELFKNFLRHNPKDPAWFNRDRFILSAGHGSALLYSLLYLFDYGLTLDDLKNFRQIDSKTPGHPEYGHTKGVEATTGPLGQGISMAVGMALAEEKLASIYNRDLKLIDHYTYALVGDGCLMEGISNEASSLAGTLNLKKLIVLYDSNNITIEGSTELAFTEDVLKRYEALNWKVFEVKDGNSLEEIGKAIELAKKSDKPSLIKINTKIGYGSPRAGSEKSHGEALGEENIKKTREFFAMKDEDFYVADEVKNSFKEIIKDLEEKYNKEKEKEKAYEDKYPDLYKDFMDNYEGKIKDSFIDEKVYDSFNKDMATRGSSGKVLNHIGKKYKNIFGGSADLAPSNKSSLDGEEYFSKTNREGRNLTFGVRENAMGAITNGILLHGGLRTYGATFLVFSDYMKPSIRLSCLMNIPNIFIFTHDSIGVGEDGPTHQAIEHLAALRSIPNIIVFRPCDGRETAVGWEIAMKSKHTPVALILTRQNLPQMENSSRDASKGAYVLKKERGELEKIVIATGSEVHLAYEAVKEMDNVRLVSMPSMELFEAQAASYREEILPKKITKRLSVEASSSFGWQKYTGFEGKNIFIDSFGVSGKGSEVYKYFDITTDHIKKAIEEL